MSEESRKEHIRSMVDSLVGGNNEQAEVDFHGAATDIVKNIMGIPTEPEYDEVDDSGYDEDTDSDTDSDSDTDED